MSMYNYNKVDASLIEYVPVATVSDLPEGERLFVEIDDLDLVVFNIAGVYFAIGDVCSHDDVPVMVQGLISVRARLVLSQLLWIFLHTPPG
jgi:nitrite reductase/ring-hydroxylating ferredoxin subunit